MSRFLTIFKNFCIRSGFREQRCARRNAVSAKLGDDDIILIANDDGIIAMTPVAAFFARGRNESVTWPDGQTTEHVGILPNRRIVVPREGGGLRSMEIARQIAPTEP